MKKWGWESLVTFSWACLLPYEELTAAVREALPGYAPGWVDFTEETMLGCTVFHLRQDELGDKLGTVKLRKLSESQSELTVSGPERVPGRSLTQEEEDSLKGAPRQRILDTLRKIDTECDELNHRRKKHYNAVIKVLFSRLNEDLQLRRAWQAREGELPDTNEPARTEAGGEAAREQRKGGRPPKESHEWAREQVHLVGRDPNEVYREWHKMDNNEELADPLDSFKKAIKDPPKKGGK